MDLESIARGGWPDLAEFSATDPAEQERIVGALLHDASLRQTTEPEVCRHIAVVSLRLLDSRDFPEDRRDLRRMQIMMLLGNASLQMEETDDAQRYLQEVLAGPSGPEFTELRRVAAANSAMLLKTSDPARAEQLLRDSLAEARAVGESISSISVTLGSLLRRRGETDEAMAVYTEAIDRAPDDEHPDTPSLAALHGNLGNVLSDLGRHAEAAPHFAAAATLFGRTKQATRRRYDHVEALLRSRSAEALPALRRNAGQIFAEDLAPLRQFLSDCAPLLVVLDDRKAWDAFLAELLDRDDVPPEVAGSLLAARVILLSVDAGYVEAAKLALDPRLEAARPSDGPLRSGLATVLRVLSQELNTIAVLWPAPPEALLSNPGHLSAVQHRYTTEGAATRLLTAAFAGRDPGPEPPVIVGIGGTGSEPPTWLGVTDPAVLERYARFRDRWPAERALWAVIRSGGTGEEERRAMVAAADLLGEPGVRAATRTDLAEAVGRRQGMTPEERLREITAILGEVRSFAARLPDLLARTIITLATYTKEIPAGDERARIDEAIRLSREAFAVAERAHLEDLVPALAIALGNALTEYQVRFDPARFEEAKAVLRRGLESLRDAPEAPGPERAFVEGTLLNSLGKTYVDTGRRGSADDLREAARLLRAAYTLRREGASIERRVRSAANLIGALDGLARLADEDHTVEIAALAEDIAALAEEAEPTALHAQALLSAGLVLVDSGSPVASVLALRAAAMLRATDTGRLLVIGLNSAGQILWRLGDRDRAIDLVTEAEAAIGPFAARASGAMERKRIVRSFAHIPRLLEQMRSTPADPPPAAPGSLREAVHARVERARRPGGLDSILRPEATAEADALAADTDDPLALYTLGWFSWLRSRALPEPERTEARETALDRLLPAFLRGVRPGVFPAPLLPDLADRAFEPAGEALQQAMYHFEENFATATIRLWENIVRALPEDRVTSRSAALLNLAAALRSRFRGTGMLTDLDAAIDATETAGRDGGGQGVELNLSGFLQDRYEASGDVADLDRAVDLLRAAIATAAEEPVVTGMLVSLGNTLMSRYEERGVDADLDEAIAATDRALGSDVDDPAAAANLSLLLTMRSERDDTPADLDRAADLMRDALARTPASFPNRCGRLAGLGNSLATRFRRTHDRADLDEAVTLLREAVEVAPHPLLRGRVRSGLVGALLTRYDAFGDDADLDEAIVAARQSVADTPPGHPARVPAQMNLGAALRHRGRARTEDEESEAIEAYERATSGPVETGSLMTARARYRLAVSLFTRSKSDGSSADFDAAIDAVRTAITIAPTGLAEPSGWIATLSAWLLERFLNSGSDADLDEAITSARAALAWEPSAEPERTAAGANLANALVVRAERSGELSDLPEAREAARKAAGSRPSDPVLWQNYLFTLHRSYLATGDATLLETAQAASAEALAHADRTSPGFPAMLANVSVVARSSDDPARFPAMIALIEDARPPDEADRVIYVADVPAEADRVEGLATQPGEIQLRHEMGLLWLTHALESKTEGLPAYERAVALFRTCLLAGGFAVPAAAAEAAAMVALPVAMALSDRALRSRAPGSVASLPAMWLRMLDALPEDSEHRPAVLTSLSFARVTRFLVCEGEPSLLDGAVSDLRAAADAVPEPERGETLRRLGNLYRFSFEQTGRIGHLTAGIGAVHEALALAGSDLQRSSFQHSLRRLLLARHHATASGADLDDALEIAQQAVALTPTDDFYYENRLAGVAEVRRAQAAHTGDAGLLNEAVEFALTAANAYADGTFRALQILELTLCLTASYASGGPPSLLDAAVGNTRHALGLGTEEIEDGVRLRSALGVALRLRHERGGAVADLDEALDLARSVLAETRPGHHARGPRLSDLAEALLLRFRREGGRADLDEAVEVARAAASHPSGTAGPSLASRLAGALLTRFERTGDRADLDAAVTAHRAAAEATPPGHPARPGRLAALALTLRRRGEHTQDVTDLTAAATLLSDLPATIDTRHLASVLRSRHALTGDPADLDAAVAALRRTAQGNDAGALCELAELLGIRNRPEERAERIAALVKAAGIEVAPPSVRVSAARAAATLLADTDPGQAVDLLEAAIRLLPEIAPRHLHRSDQLRALADTDGLVAEAVELLLTTAPPADSGAARRALELLESGRSVLLGQALELDGDLTALRADHPELAGRYETLRAALTSGDTQRRDATEFAAVLREIRAEDGYAAFPRAGSLADLLGEAADGAVVTFTVGRTRGHALLLTPAGITAVELPGLTRHALTDHAAAFYSALRAAPSASGHLERVTAQKVVTSTLAWLWETAARPVLDTLGHPARPGTSTEALPRIWWAPGGLLGSLPLHAAGVTGDGVLDRVVSSYTPTISALQHARRPVADTTPGSPRALVVAMPTTPGDSRRLDHVPDEVAVLRTHFLMPTVITEPEPGAPARISGATPLPTCANVVARLPGCAIVHFACHGYTDAEDPSRSGLLLHDHSSDPFTIARLAPLRLENAQLAYLSACQTAVTRTAALADEAIHLASAFQLAGYRHVIGTLWEVSDRTAVTVADDFYSALGAGVFDTAGSAAALHRAIRRARDRAPNLPWLWAAYMHTGA